MPESGPVKNYGGAEIKKLFPFILLLMMLMAGCDLAGINLPITTQSAIINSFGASPPSISAGGSSTLNWSVSGATTVSIDQGIGNVALAGNRLVTPAATTVYTLTATSASGASTSATAQVVVSGSSPTPSPYPQPTPTGLPVISYFTASPTTIYAGSPATLSWSVSNATSISIDHGVGTVGSSGSTSVYPATSTNYTLTAINAAGLSSKSAYVFVNSGQSSFSVISVTASANPPSFTGACPTNFYSEAVITVNGPGTVTYNWERSDGAFSRIASLIFDGPGSQVVNVSWSLDETGSYWARVHVLTPNEIVSNQANFSVSCTGAETLDWTGTWLITEGQNAWGNVISFSQTGNTVTGSYLGHENGTYNGIVSGNLLTGTWSEEPTYLPPNDAGEFQITISPDGNFFVGQWRYDSSGTLYDWSGQRPVLK